MGLSNDLRSLRERVLGELTAAHGYCSDTKNAWSLVRRFIRSGNIFEIRNPVTGTVTTQIELEAWSRGFVTEQLTEATFQQFLSLFEGFYFDLLRLWLTTYPRSLGKKTLDFKIILDLPDEE